jgi:serine/threonine-protein kinase
MGRRPQIEAYLADAAERERPALFRELLLLEIEFRATSGERPTVVEYLARFPGNDTVIESAFEESANAHDASVRARRPEDGCAERNLLIGALALEMDVVSQDALIAAMRAYVTEEDRSLGQILRNQGALSPERQAELESLVDARLTAHPRAPLPDELTRAAGAAGRATPMDASTIGAPTSAGTRFRILRLYDRGGLGNVYVARDQELNRDVALKEIQPHRAHDPGSRARFLLEAEVTGGLEHPAVVPVYGLGTYADGRPYYAMRLVKGETLKEAVARFHSGESAGQAPGGRAVEFRQLLRRFVDVCNAVAYAHSRGVLHRDLKPSNILLGPYGETLVVDWGLAKVVGRPMGPSGAVESTLSVPASGASGATLPGSALGTPAYMSPEQAAGQPEAVGPASDVYSLGATLYGLLTGRAPFESGDLDVVLGAVRRGDFPRPRRLNPAVPLALEAVCLKAMALEPDDRYASPQGLAEDVDRWTAGEAVSVYRDPLHVRAWRRLKRHRTLVTSVAAATLMAIVTLAGATLLLMAVNRRERQARAEADANFRRTLDVVDRMSLQVGDDLLVSVPRAKPVREQLLAEARHLLEQLLKEQPSNPAVRLVAGRYYARHESKFYRDLNQLAAAEESLRRGIDLLAVLGSGSIANTDPRPRAELAAAYSVLGYVLRDRSRLGEAREMGRRAVDLLDVAAANSGNPSPYLLELGLALLRQGRILADLGQDRDAEASFLRSLAVFERLIKVRPDEARYRQGCARILHFLGWFTGDHDRHEESERYYLRARDLREGLVKEFPTVVSHRYDLGDTYNNLMIVMTQLKRVAEVERYFDLLYRLEKGLAEEFPERPVYRAMLGLAQVNLADAYLKAGRSLRRARELLERGIIELRAAIALASEVDLMHRRWLSGAYGSQVKVFTLLGQFSHADVAMRELLKTELPQGQHLFVAARALAYAAPRLRESAGLPSLQRIVLSLCYRTRAMSLLQDAATKGFATAQRIETETDLDDLRALSEYRTLLAGLGRPVAKAKPRDQ